ncbi:MAG: P-II family nitrogen regulator [Planctomycetota bacterium]|jgi:nitrogen regulatory protein P-II 1|nr:P-II family nitrogen regulator [Planctomycetota bacterium]
MIKIEAIVRREKFEEVKDALSRIEVNGISVSEVMGCGKQKGYVELVRGSEVPISLLPKIKFEIVVSDDGWADKTIKAIKESAFTGNPGDGKIFTYRLDNVIRIRTGESGSAAIN